MKSLKLFSKVEKSSYNEFKVTHHSLKAIRHYNLEYSLMTRRESLHNILAIFKGCTDGSFLSMM